MSKLYTFLALQLISFSVLSQGSVGINTGVDGPHESAILDLNSTDKGLKLPLANPIDILNPTLGLITHHNGVTYHYTLTGWKPWLSQSDLMWEIMYNYIRTIQDNSIVIGRDDPLLDSKLTVDNTGDAPVDNGIYSITSKGVSFYGESSDVASLASVHGKHDSPTGIHYGGMFETESIDGAGVYGLASNDMSNSSMGGYFESDGTLGIGVKGIVTNVSGSHTYGGQFINYNTIGSGIYAGIHNTSAGIGSIAGQFSNDGISGYGISVNTGNSLGVNNHAGVFLTSGTNSYGIRSNATGASGIGVKGLATNTDASSINYGGHFTSEGQFGVGVYGLSTFEATSSQTFGGYFKSKGIYGVGVYGEAEHSSAFGNYGGYFKSKGIGGTGAYCSAEGLYGTGINAIATNVLGENTYGGYFTAKGISGAGVRALADNSEGEAIGGLFSANGENGWGVQGSALSYEGINTYGGYFNSNGLSGAGVRGEAENIEGVQTYGGTFNTQGTTGAGVQGAALNTEGNNTYGGYFTSYGSEGTGVFGYANNNQSSVNHGGYFEANGIAGIGAVGRSSGIAGTGVVGVATGNNASGAVGETTGSNSKAVWGINHSLTGDTYSGYFTTNSTDGTGIYARGKKYGALIDGDLVVNTYNNSTAKVSLFEANDYGFEFEYEGAADKLHLWSKKFSGNEARRMTWQKNGNVGIGTETPDYALDIEKDANQGLRLKSTNGFSEILIDGTAGTNEIEFLESSVFKAGMGWSVPNQHFFIYQQGNALVVKDGKVGIKNVNPNHSLELPNNSTTGVARAFEWIDYSDERIKKDVKDIPYGLETICRLQPKSYNQHTSNFEKGELKLEDEYKYTVGLLAQEVHKVIPEIVYQPTDENTDLWSMNYQKIIPVLIQAVKEQNELVNNQNVLIEQLNRKLSEFKNKTEEQETRLQKVEAALINNSNQ